MAMRDDFAIFILTYGRPNRQITYNYLRNNMYSGKIYFVLSDDDKTIEEYRSKYGDEKIIIFNKEESLSMFDIGDNFDDNRAVVFARNKLYELAKSVGIKYAMVLDDDYVEFRYRINSNGCYANNTPKVLQPEKLIKACLDYFLEINALSIALSQGGDFIGGKYSSTAKTFRSKRKVMNSFLFDTDKPMEFQGRINEDLTASVLAGMRGNLVFTIPFADISQLDTQTNSGGLTDIYLNLGTYVKSFYSVMMAPSCIKIAVMGDTHKRIHHQVSWNNAAPKILNEKHKVK